MVFMTQRKDENKITSINFNDPLINQYYCYVLDSPNKLGLEDRKTTNKDGDIIVSFSDEYDLLKIFSKVY